jgi:hypothetical protein
MRRRSFTAGLPLVGAGALSSILQIRSGQKIRAEPRDLSLPSIRAAVSIASSTRGDRP